MDNFCGGHWLAVTIRGMDDKTVFDLSSRAAMPSLYDPQAAAAVLEKFVDREDRAAGGLAYLFCDEDGKLLQPVLAPHETTGVDDEDRWQALRWATGLCTMVGDNHPAPLGLILAVVRESGPVCDEDRAWHQVALDACAEVGAPLLAMHLVTSEGVSELPAAPRAA